jgi:hypothetical protein
MGQPTRKGIDTRMHTVSKQTRGTETSQYAEEKKANAIPSVAASERGTAQTVHPGGVAGTNMTRSDSREASGKSHHRR